MIKTLRKNLWIFKKTKKFEKNSLDCRIFQIADSLLNRTRKRFSNIHFRFGENIFFKDLQSVFFQKEFFKNKSVRLQIYEIM